MGIVLFIIAVILFIPLSLIGFGYAMFKPNRVEYFYDLAYSIDQLGNVACQHAFNKWLISDTGYSFGNPDETISSVVGKNKRFGTLTKSGRLLERILHLLDPNHSEDAIEVQP